MALWLFPFSMRNCILLFFLSFVLFLVSCGEDSHHFKIEGHLLQMNQGEFYIYSEDASVDGIDTIKVEGGRFAYEIPCQHSTTLTLVFPNFSELPIFAEPGKTVSINGDASHLKMLEIKGTKTNELMSKFREQIAQASPPEIVRYATQFIEDHPESPIGVWLLKKYFIASPTPDYDAALRLLKVMQKEQPENGTLSRLSGSMEMMKNSGVGRSLPSFSLTDINGNIISSSTLSTGTAVICTWASWNYSSQDMLRRLQTLQSDGNVKILAISLDASKYDCKNTLRMSQVTFPVVCTGEMFETKPLRKLGMLTVPDNIIVKNGKIVARDLSPTDLMKKIDELH